MRAYIKKLQSKNEFVRKQIFIGAMIVSMVFVGFIWVYNLNNRFNNNEVSVQTQKDVKPFKIFTDSLSNTYNNISASVGNIPNLETEKKKITNEKQINLIVVKDASRQ